MGLFSVLVVMSSLVQAYQGNTVNLTLSFSDEQGNPLNLSGCLVYYTALPNYAETGYLFNIKVTGNQNNTNGQIVIPLTAQDTNQCPGDYPAAVTFSGNGVVQTYGTDGFRVIAAPLILN